MARVKRSPKRMANCALAMHHSRASMVHSFSERFKTRNSSFRAASSVGKWPRARTARRSFAFRASMALVVYTRTTVSTVLLLGLALFAIGAQAQQSADDRAIVA